MSYESGTIRRRSYIDTSSPSSAMQQENGGSDGSDQSEAQQHLLGTAALPRPGLLRSPSTPALMRVETFREVRTILYDSYRGTSKALLVFVPIAIVAGALGVPAVVVFLLNFVALAALAALIIFTVLMLTKSAGASAGLLRAVLGNATELIVWKRLFFFLLGCLVS